MAQVDIARKIARMLTEEGCAYIIDETKKLTQWILQKCSLVTKL